MIYANTYYVGTRGLGSLLITPPTGHVLIDEALPESVPQIAAHIRSLRRKYSGLRSGRS